jgi:predicted ATP-grasp superfamily ATP-dependent carboligase
MSQLREIDGTAHALRIVLERVPPTTPPALILGGSANALSVARSLGRRGIKVYLSASDGRHVQYSRYCTKSFPFGGHIKGTDFWRELLLGSRGKELHGSVILVCNDEAVSFVANHRSELSAHYRLDDSVPHLQLAMLDKRETLALARSVNIPAPRFWQVETPAQLEAIEGSLSFPLIVKPIHSHLFQKQFAGRKYLPAADVGEVRNAMTRVWAAGLQAMICEWIPGPDSLLSSYYTYIDRNGKPLFHFTKKVIRRFPKNEGLTSYHITNWDPGVAGLGLRFLSGIKFRGLANVEFKHDLRDGLLKVVEVNARFTAPQELFVRCGLDTASLIYDDIVGLPLPKHLRYRQGVRLWYPMRDFLAYQQLNELNELSFGEWLKSIWHRQALPFFQPSDPLPTIVPALLAIRERMSGGRRKPAATVGAVSVEPGAATRSSIKASTAET